MPEPLSPPPHEALRVLVRWMIHDDLPAVAEIERLNAERTVSDRPHAPPRGVEQLSALMADRQRIGIVAEHGTRIVGFSVYRLKGGEVAIEQVAVHPSFRRRGVGRRLLDRLKDKLTSPRRGRLAARVRETSLGSQLFLAAAGFRAVEVLRGYHEDTGEDSYTFEFSPDTEEV